ncbi:MAG: S8 family serine peptidase [Candidatus Methanoperedens sp.]|nr:S8 family serine peptidase [Candidatus Methanoperedens sp.]
MSRSQKKEEWGKMLDSKWNKLFLIVICFFLIGTILSEGSSRIPEGLDFHNDNAILLKNLQFDTSKMPPSFSVSGMSIKQYPADMEGYYIVQFKGFIQDEWKQTVRDSGAVIFDYVPNNAFIVRMNASVKANVESLDIVQWAGIYQPSFRISPVLQTAGEDHVNITVLLFDAMDNRRISEQINNLGGEVVEDAGGIMRVRIDRSKISDIAVMNGVSWIEKYVPPVIFNDVASNITGVYTVRNTQGLNGSGQIVAVADTGLDTGVNDTSMHDDIEGRIVALIDRSGNGAADLYSGHGTHVAGSVLGNGIKSGGQFKGMAPDAQLVFQAVESTEDSLSGIPEDLKVLFQQAYDRGARIHTNSWGSSVNGQYTIDSQNLDLFAWEHPDMLILMAAGNEGTDSDSDGVIDLDSIGSPATAKNSLTVGASENYRPSFLDTWYSGFGYINNPIRSDKISDNIEGLAAFSSRGPTDDGRIKPDVVAPGTFIISLRSSVSPAGGLWSDYNTYYRYSGGTSMSTPIVAGIAALIRQYYVQNESISPSAALLKATIINGADNMTPGQYGTGAYKEIQSRPDNAQGWGRVNISNSLFPSAPQKMRYQDNTTGLSTSQSWNTSYNITSNSEPLRVTLVWTDYKGNPAALIQLVNNLTLNVTTPSGSYYLGNEGDSVNNVEQVELSSPAVGWYNISVEGTNVPHGPQQFAIVLSGSFYTAYGVNMTVDSTARTTISGVNATYTLILTNNGTETDTYNLSVDNPNNSSVAALNISGDITLASSAVRALALNVTNSTNGTFYVNVTAHSNTYPSKFMYINTTTIAHTYDVNLTTDYTTKTTNAGINATYTLVLQNNGSTTDTYNLTITNPNGASVAAINMSGNITLVSGALQVMLMNVTNTSSGTFRVNVTARSNNDTSKFMYVNTTTTVPSYGVNMTVDQASMQVNAGVNATYTISLQNNGTASDTYNLTVENTNNASIAGINITTNITLASSATYILTLNVSNHTSGNFHVNVTARSSNDTSKFMSVNTTTTIPVGINITYPANNSIFTNKFVNVTATLDNNGTARYLNWQGQNHSMLPDTVQSAGTVFYWNMTGLLSGNYSFRVYANGSDGVMNVSEIRTITVNLTTTTDLSSYIDPTTGNFSNDTIITSPGGNVTITIFSGVNATFNGTTLNNITTDSLAQINSSYSLDSSRDRFIGENLTLGPEGSHFIPDIKTRFNYTDTQLTAAGLRASTLRIKFYNTTTSSWVEQTPYTINDTGKYIIANISHFSTFALIGSIPETSTTTSTSSSGGGGGGGGGGASGENYSNIELKEKRDLHIYKDRVSSYKFNTTDPIMYVNLTGNINSGEITTTVEVLRNTSSIVNGNSSPGIVYKNMNIWVGTSGFATSKNIQKGVISFRVQNSWLKRSGVTGNDVKMVKWDGTAWLAIETKKIIDDSEYTYYEAYTDSFSPFAITAVKSAEPHVEEIKTPIITETTEPEETKIKLEKTPESNGGLLMMTVVLLIIVAILAAFYSREKKKIRFSE